MKKILAILLSVAFVLGVNAQNKYDEDLAVFRPVTPVRYIPLAESVRVNESLDTVSYRKVEESTEAVDKKIAELKKYYGESTMARGYRVQVFSSSDKTNAEKVEKEMKEVLDRQFDGDGPVVYNKYDQPVFRIKIGDYILKERAFHMLYLVKQIEGYENALLVPDLIDIKKID